MPSGITRTGAIQLILKQRGELVNKVSFDSTPFDSPKPIPMDLKELADSNRKEKLLPSIDVDVEVIDGE